VLLVALAAILHSPQVGIEALRFLEQGIMRASFNDFAFVHHDDAVGMAHGGEAVRDDEHGAALANMLHIALDDGFAFVI
jgi:hypothetical protein